MTTMTNETPTKGNGASHDFRVPAPSVGARLESLSHDAGQKLGAMASGVARSASEYVKTGRDYVKENPAKGVAIAAAAGLVAGSLLTLALRRRGD